LRSILQPEDEGVNVILTKKTDPSILFNSVFIKNDGEKKFKNANTFLENSDYYYNQVTSVPWLNELRKKNPKLKIEIFTVDGMSFYKQVEEGFVKDMQNCGAIPLVSIIKEYAKQITYIGINIGNNISLGAQDYNTWMILPDKRMVPISWWLSSDDTITSTVKKNNSNKLCTCDGSGIILSPEGVVDSEFFKTSIPVLDEIGYKPEWTCSKI
jgi:hypothetical protein